MIMNTFLLSKYSLTLLSDDRERLKIKIKNMKKVLLYYKYSKEKKERPV